MEIIRYTSPFLYEKVLSLIEETFGKSEAMLELPQMNGVEAEYNTDWIYVAWEGDRILGTVHATIPKKERRICGVSGVCTAPEARGKGVAKKLFARMMSDVDAAGVRVCLLGTGNPIAAKLYASFGFSYLVCSGVMARFRDCDLVDFTKRAYANEPEQFRIVDGSPDFRIAMIPLVLHQGEQQLLDRNTNIMAKGMFAQGCCMSLFQRYLNLRDQGGEFYGAVDEGGMLGAMASILPTDRGLRGDFFCVKSFLPAARELLKHCEEKGEMYLQLFEGDKQKRAIAEELGYRPEETVDYAFGCCRLSTVIYRK